MTAENQKCKSRCRKHGKRRDFDSGKSKKCKSRCRKHGKQRDFDSGNSKNVNPAVENTANGGILTAEN